MTTSIEEIISRTEADLREVLDQIKTTEYRLKALNREATIHRRVLDALKTALEATAGSAASQAFDDEPAAVQAPPPADVPHAPEVAAAPSPLPAAVGANGFDRASLKRQLRQWHIRYPLGVSHRVPSQMMRQALRATLLDHEGYREDWLSKGGINFGDSVANYTLQDMRDAAAILGVDAEAVMNHAHKVQRLFLHYGVPGVDRHHWGD